MTTKKRGKNKLPPLGLSLPDLSAWEPTPSIANNVVATYVAPDFDALLEVNEPQERGYAFEALNQRLFRMCGYDVARNSAIARPRQTDHTASKGGETYLVESRWRSEPVNRPHVDEMEARLKQAPVGTIGCIVAMSPALDSARERILELRRRELGFEIVLFEREETEGLFRGYYDLDDALAWKLHTLRSENAVGLLGTQRASRLARLDIPLPSSRWKIVVGRRTRTTIDAPGGPDYMVMTRSGRVPPHRLEAAVALLIDQLDIDNLDELMALFELLQAKLSLTSDGAFTIAQTNHTWVGWGASELLAELPRVRARYRSASLQQWHHSEDFTYFDTFRGGCLVVSGRQDVGRRRFHDVQLELRLDGIPLDAIRYRDLAVQLGAPDASLEVLSESEHRIHHFRERPTVEPIAFIHDRAERDLIAGIAARNPFFGWEHGRLQEYFGSEYFYHLGEIEMLTGRLTDWLSTNEVVETFTLRRVQVATFDRAALYDFMVDHGPIVRTGSHGGGT